MEENTESSSKLGWEILDCTYGRTQQIDHLMSPFNNEFNHGISSNKEPFFFDPLYFPSQTISSPSSSSVVCSGEQLISFVPERQTREWTDTISFLPKNCSKTSSISQASIVDGGSLSTPSKRSKDSSYQRRNTPQKNNPFCQVQGCNIDLKSAKDYHKRHRICEAHSKSPRVVLVGGFVRRFCQQCSRFHDLSEFDDEKRSCRRRLLDHNARRRRGIRPSNLRSSQMTTLYGGTNQMPQNSIASHGDQYFSSAPSLLSTNSWSFNNAVYSSFMNSNLNGDSSEIRRFFSF